MLRQFPSQDACGVLRAMFSITINGRQLAAEPEQTILQVAQAAGVTIPTLCYHPDLSLAGSCRLCLVNVQGEPHPVAACTTRVAPGMVVETENPHLAQLRKAVLSLLVLHHPGAAAADPSRWTTGAVSEEAQSKNAFWHWVRHYGVEPPRGAAPRYPEDGDPHPLIRVDLNQCILCTRCVRACAEVQGRFVWHLRGRGAEMHITPGAAPTMLDARCESCGACVAYCPTHALADRTLLEAGPPDRLVRTTCSYCGVGCQFDLNIQKDRIIGVTTTSQAPVNGHRLCVKGRYGWDYVHHPQRLTRPRVRQYLLEGRRRAPDEDRGPWVEVDWPTALDLVARRLAEVWCRRGGEALAVFSSAKCTNEENYLAQKLARQVLSTNHVDHCARLCHSSSVTALLMTIGSGAMSNTLADLAHQSQVIFVIGSNTTEQHPVFGTMLRQAVLRRGVPLVVADPRRIDLAELATEHLRHRPGTDVALLNGLMHILWRRGWYDRQYIQQRTEGFEELCRTLEKYPPERVSRTTGVPQEQLFRVAELLGTRRPGAAIWGMGMTQHTTGVLNVLALVDLQLMLGNIGRPGGGVNPLRGQNNVQGACDMGALPNVLPGYARVTDPQARGRFQQAWQAGEAVVPAEPGLTVTEVVAAAGRGEVEALYILGEDPLMTEPDLNHARQALHRAPFVVLQEIFPSETSHCADVLLPGAAWAEKDGTFTNTERRVQLIRQALSPPGEARPDWWIMAQVARRTLHYQKRVPQGPWAAWDYEHPRQIMQEIAALVPSYAGITYQRLQQGEPLHWPVWDQQHPGTPILHQKKFPLGRGRFHPAEQLPPDELPGGEFPLLLTTGRVLFHWHGGELTRRSQLLRVYPEALVEISPEDARRLGIQAGQPVVVRSRRGTMQALAQVTHRVPPGVVFGTFHFPGEHNANNLTNPALDPRSKIPEYKVCAVRVEPLATAAVGG